MSILLLVLLVLPFEAVAAITAAATISSHLMLAKPTKSRKKDAKTDTQYCNVSHL